MLYIRECKYMKFGGTATTPKKLLFGGMGMNMHIGMDIDEDYE